MSSERDNTSDYEPLPDSRPPLWYLLFAVVVASLGMLVMLIVLQSFL